MNLCLKSDILNHCLLDAASVFMKLTVPAETQTSIRPVIIIKEMLQTEDIMVKMEKSQE